MGNATRHESPIHLGTLLSMSKTHNGQYGFFDLKKQLAKIYELNDCLPKLNSLIDWEMFRPLLSKVRKDKDPTKGGRPSKS